MIAGGAAFLSGAGLASPGASASPAASAATAGDGRSYADFAASAATAATGSTTPAAGAGAAAQSAPANATSSQPANPSAAAAPAAGSATPPAGGSDTMQPNPANATLPLPAANAGAAGLAAAAHQIRRGTDAEAPIPDATQSMQAALTPQIADTIPAPLATSTTASKDDTQAALASSSDPQQLLALLAGSLAITAPVTPAANASTLPAADASVTGAAKAVNPALLAGNAVGANAASTAATPAAATAPAPAPTGDAQPLLASGVAFTAPAQPLTDAATLPTTDRGATNATKGATAALIAGNAAGALQQSPGLVSTGALAALLDPKAAATAAPADALKLAVGAALEREGANGFALPDSKDDRSDALSFGGLVQGTPSLDRPLTANAVTATPMSMPAQLDEGFDDSFGTRIAWMAEQKLGHAEIRLNPEHAGPIDVRIQLDGTQVNAAFHSANADVRQALEASLPRLRDLLGQQGLQLGNTDIGQRQQSGQQQDQGAAPRSQGQSFGSDAFGNGRATAQASVAPVVVRSRGLLDEYA